MKALRTRSAVPHLIKKSSAHILYASKGSFAFLLFHFSTAVATFSHEGTSRETSEASLDLKRKITSLSLFCRSSVYAPSATFWTRSSTLSKKTFPHASLAFPAFVVDSSSNPRSGLRLRNWWPKKRKKVFTVIANGAARKYFLGTRTTQHSSCHCAQCKVKSKPLHIFL